MGGILQGSWGIGFLMSFAIYGLFYNSIGWRGMLIVGVLPALAVVYVRFFVKEPAVWVENRRLQKRREARGQGAAVQHFQARHDRQHLDRVLVDGERVRHLLFGHRAVRDASSGRPQDVAGGDRRGRRRRQPRHLPVQRGLGLGGRQDTGGGPR